MSIFSPSVVDFIIMIAVSVLLILYITSNRQTEEKTSFKKQKLISLAEFSFSARAETIFCRLSPYLFRFSLTALGLIILAWTGWLIWYDMTWWSKDIILIFFGSRTGEAISLGIGMKVFNYFLIGLILPLSGLVISSRRRISS